MVFEHIEKLKQEYTDKYVVVDNERPELKRFDGQTGVVRTVNMNGRALVEFDAYDNIGWYDIDIDFLKIIDRPLPKPEAKADKPKADKAKSAADKKPAAKPSSGGMSVEDMLAAARGEKGSGAPAAKADPPAKKEAPAAVAKPTTSMSVADMLAAARAEKSDDDSGVAAPAAEAEPVSAESEAESSPEPEPAAASASQGALPTDTQGIVDYCRKTDGS